MCVCVRVWGMRVHAASKGGAKPLKIVSTIESAKTISKTMAKSNERQSAAVAAVAAVAGGSHTMDPVCVL